MTSMIFAGVGYFFLIGALAGALQGELLTAFIVFLTSIALLLKSTSGNHLISKLAGRNSIPTKSGWVHSGAALVLLMIGGSTLPPKDDLNQDKSASTTTIKPKVISAAPANHSPQENQELPSCIKARLADAKSLWAQLKQARYEPEFHKFGFGQGSSFGKWELARQESNNLYTKCQNNLGGPMKYKFMGLAESYSYMHYVGKDWYQTSGKGKSNTQDFIDMIEFALANDGKAK